MTVAGTGAILLLTTNPGLADVVVGELRERLAGAGLADPAVTRLDEPVRGRVRVQVPASEAEVLPAAWRLRTVHHILRPLTWMRLDRMDDPAPMAELAARVEVPELTPDTPFRVTAERSGHHAFGSHDIQRVVGAAVQRHFGAPVSLTEHAVDLRVDVVETYVRVSRQLTDRPLSMRHPMVYRQRVALRATVAHAAVRLGAHGLDRPPARIADPFCGTGTLLLEAGSVYPAAELLGADRTARAAEGARANLDAAGMAGRARVERFDARELADHWPEASLDLVLSNPPYGRRMGREIPFERFYGDLMAQLRRVVRPGGRVAILVDRRARFLRAVHRVGGFGIPHRRALRTSGTYPTLVVLERHWDGSTRGVSSASGI